MEHLLYIVDLFLHLDKHLVSVVQDYGTWTYAILFLIVFCETGLVVTPILPGDSLLFAIGALTARGAFDLPVVLIVLIAGAVLGDAVNYQIGARIGPRVFQNKESRIFRKEYLEKTEKFYHRYGGKTIIIARFVPIVRTFAPFLAGVGRMGYLRFAIFNISGAVLWILSITLAGYFFSELPIVKNNFGLVVLAIIIVSILPAVVEVIKSRRDSIQMV